MNFGEEYIETGSLEQGVEFDISDDSQITNDDSYEVDVSAYQADLYEVLSLDDSEHETESDAVISETESELVDLEIESLHTALESDDLYDADDSHDFE